MSPIIGKITEEVNQDLTADLQIVEKALKSNNENVELVEKESYSNKI